MKAIIPLLLACSLAWTASAQAVEMQVKCNLQYAGKGDARRTLDVYYAEGERDRPVIIWLHGGAWRFGDKRSVQEKPQAFVDAGFVFIAINYRFVPKVTMDEIAGDVASAIRWARDHADEYGGSSKQLFVGGHSAGAHLAALVCTDPRYLKAHDMALADIAGCIPVDTPTLDAAGHIVAVQKWNPRGAKLYLDAFGKEPEMHKKYSPITYVVADRGIPPFCVLYVESRLASRAKAREFAVALRKANGQATLVPGKDKSHTSINRDLGKKNDQPTAAMFEFLDGLTK